jgi:hypothetical protein
VKIDVLKRSVIKSDIASALLDELRKRDLDTVTAIQAPSDKSEFEFGMRCGECRERQAIRSFVEHLLNASDPTGRTEEADL